MTYKRVKFIYINEYQYREPIEVKQFAKMLRIDKRYLEAALRSNMPERLHVFSFDQGVLIISDLLGNCFSVVPASGLVEIYGLLSGYANKETIMQQYDKFGQNIDEFYRVNPDDCEYSFSKEYLNGKVVLSSGNCRGEFDENEFIKALVSFTDEITEWYDSRYPLFLDSPVRSAILKLKDRVKNKYLL